MATVGRCPLKWEPETDRLACARLSGGASSAGALDEKVVGARSPNRSAVHESLGRSRTIDHPPTIASAIGAHAESPAQAGRSVSGSHFSGHLPTVATRPTNDQASVSCDPAPRWECVDLQGLKPRATMVQALLRRARSRAMVPKPLDLPCRGLKPTATMSPSAKALKVRGRTRQYSPLRTSDEIFTALTVAAGFNPFASTHLDGCLARSEALVFAAIVAVRWRGGRRPLRGRGRPAGGPAPAEVGAWR